MSLSVFTCLVQEFKCGWRDVRLCVAIKMREYKVRKFRYKRPNKRKPLNNQIVCGAWIEQVRQTLATIASIRTSTFDSNKQYCRINIQHDDGVCRILSIIFREQFYGRSYNVNKYWINISRGLCPLPERTQYAASIQMKERKKNNYFFLEQIAKRCSFCIHTCSHNTCNACIEIGLNEMNMPEKLDHFGLDSIWFVPRANTTHKCNLAIGICMIQLDGLATNRRTHNSLFI